MLVAYHHYHGTMMIRLLCRPTCQFEISTNTVSTQEITIAGNNFGHSVYSSISDFILI